MLCSCRNPLFWGRGSVTQGQGNRHVRLCQPAEAGCRFSEELSSECSWCEENAQGAKAAWGWRKREPGPRSCLGEWDGVWFWGSVATWALVLQHWTWHKVTETAQSLLLQTLQHLLTLCYCCTCDVLLVICWIEKKGSSAAEGLYKNSWCLTCKECEWLQLEKGQKFKNKQEKTPSPKFLPSVPLLHMFIPLILYRRNRELRAGF